MPTYTYRSGVAPTAADAATEMAREEATATATRLAGSAFSRIHEIWPALAWTSDTNADEYTGILLLDGTAVKGSRQEFPAIGIASLGSGATIAPFPLITNTDPQTVEVESAGAGDLNFMSVQHGDAIALGFSAMGITFS